MKMPIIFTILISIVVIFVGYYIYNYVKMLNTPSVGPKTDVQNLPRVVIGENNEFTVEIADTDALRQKGLMNRAYLDPGHGMLFKFDNTAYHSFWMKNTLIPLDMIWINADQEIVYIYKNAEPCSNIITAICNSIIPLFPGKYVFEINAGLSDKLNIQKGDKVQFKF